MQQEIEECMNTITATMTKLRAEIRKLGMAGTEPECTCPPTTLYPPGGMANEPISINVDCPIHGRRPTEQAMVKGTIEEANPDLPLRARVAKALGKKVREHDKIWEMLIPVDFSEYSYCKWIPIPDYDKHVDLAMGALEERCRKEKWCPNSMQFIDGKWEVAIGYRQMTKIAMRITSNSLSEAICEAIAKHAEGV